MGLSVGKKKNFKNTVWGNSMYFDFLEGFCVCVITAFLLYCDEVNRKHRGIFPRSQPLACLHKLPRESWRRSSSGVWENFWFKNRRISCLQSQTNTCIFKARLECKGLGFLFKPGEISYFGGKMIRFQQNTIFFLQAGKKFTSCHHSAFLTLHKPITLKSLKANWVLLVLLFLPRATCIVKEENTLFGAWLWIFDASDSHRMLRVSIRWTH